MENLVHVIVTTGTIRKWHEADREGYYSAGYWSVLIVVSKLVSINYCMETTVLTVELNLKVQCMMISKRSVIN